MICGYLLRGYNTAVCKIPRFLIFGEISISFRKSEELIKQELEALREEDKLSPDFVFRDPYFLEFLNLADTYSEKDMESAILRELERFLLEIGSDFAFVARQKRFTVDDDDFYIDLLFYHRRLRRLVVIELKLGKFMPADFGQLEFYLRRLDKYERQAGEESPIGLILCSEKSTERVEILQLEKQGIRVAEYMTELPDKKLLKQKLHDAIVVARKRLVQAESAKKIKSAEVESFP